MSASGSTWEGTGQWLVELSLPQPASRALSFSLKAAGSASTASDTKLEPSLLFAAGSRAARVLITLVDDREREARETLTLSVEGVPSAASYTLEIADDDDTSWPTSDPVIAADAVRAFPGENLSGLAYRPAQGATAAGLWLLRNSPSQLYLLQRSAALYSPVTSNGWSDGKGLVFTSGMGAPDVEGIALAEWSSPLVYTVSERDGTGPSAPIVLAYDTSASGATLRASHTWGLSNDLSALNLGANTGPEALTWVPDSYLTSARFLDEVTGQAYDPARYPDHGTGLFLVGIEQTGDIFAYALNHATGAVTRVARIASGHPGVMALEFDRDVGYLWAWCDDTCGNRATILRVEDNAASPRAGRFTIRRLVNKPASLPDVNNEGMTIASSAECSENKKAVLWIEDGTDEHVLRQGSVPCGDFLDR